MSRIEERLQAMQVDTSGMTTEEKFTAATGLTHYDEETAANDWYVPGGAANVVTESEQQGEQGQQGAQGNSEPEAGEQGEQGAQGNSEPEAGEQGAQGNSEPEAGEQGEQGSQGNPSEIEVETEP